MSRNGETFEYTLKFNAELESVKSAAKELQNLFKNTNIDPLKTKNLQNMFSGLNDALRVLEERSGKAISSMTDKTKIDNAKKSVLSYVQGISREFAQLGDMGNSQLSKKIKGISDSLEASSKAFGKYDDALSSTKKQAKQLGDQLNTLQEIQKKQERLATVNKDLKSNRGKRTNLSNELDNIKEQLRIERGRETKAKSAYEKYIKENNISLTQKGRPNALVNQNDGITEEQIKKANKLKDAYDDIRKSREQLESSQKTKQTDFDKVDSTIKNLENEQTTLKTALEGVNDTLDQTKAKVKDAQQAIQKFNEEGRNTSAFNELKSALKNIFGEELVKDIDNTSEGIKTLKERIENLNGEKVQELKAKFPELFGAVERLGNSAEEMGRKVNNGLESFSHAREAASDLDNLSSRLKYFFSLAGGFNLMRRAIRNAVTTTKELDAVMTQTAVVSQYSVADMWKKLPEYSNQAKQLGAAIKDVYSAQTLYVQQGLDMNSAMEIGVETMKMARVAGIAAAEATNSMTAALRGFNMELNETSAQRINDVYSKLAQNTASNVQEISTAMTKVAALANSANMSFENTSAFLATIIESTREGAETAGTALKTVVARFTEVKKLYKKGELTGTDEEGQEVDVNKISAALRTAGINMNEFFTGAKGLDEIFKDLGSKWSSLTTVQQRYIATMAAGSRQQSRFLALMQNYDRAIQLTEMAYNSAGSGQEQFEKTLDSLEAKLAQLKDTWDTFIMGIANSDLIKGFIDFGTQILTTINKITDTLSGGNGLVKSIESLALAFGLFKGVGGIFKGALRGVYTSITNPNEKEQQFFLKRWGNSLQQRGKYWSAAFKKDEVSGKRYFGPLSGVRRNDDIEKEIAANKKIYENDKAAYETSQKELTDLREQGAKDWAKSEGKHYIGTSREDIAAQREKDYNEAIANKEAEVKTNEETLAKSQKKLTAAAQKSNDTLMAQASAMQTAGVAAGILAGMLGAISSELEKTGNYKTAAVISGIAKGFGILSAALTLCGTMFMAFGAAAQAGSAMATVAIESIPIIGWAAAAVSAIIAVISILNNLGEVAEKQKEEISEALEENQTDLKELKNSYNEINNSLEEIDQKQETLEKMTEGTTVWKEAVEELNSEIRNLLEDFPKLAEAIKFDENGNLTLDVTAAKKINEERKQAIKDKEIASLAFQNTLTDNTVGTVREQYDFGTDREQFRYEQEKLEEELAKAAKEGHFTNLPINTILNWYRSLPSANLERYYKDDLNTQGNLNPDFYTSANGSIVNTGTFKDIVNLLAKMTYGDDWEDHTEEITGAFSDTNHTRQILGTLLNLYNTTAADFLNNKDIKNNSLLLRGQEITEKFKDFNTGSFRNFLLEQTEEIFLKKYNEWDQGELTDNDLIREYHSKMGHLGTVETGFWDNGKKVETVSTEVARSWARTNDAFIAVDNYLEERLEAIEKLSDADQKLLRGYGTVIDYYDSSFKTNLINIANFTEDQADNLIKNFNQSFKNLDQLMEDIDYSKINDEGNLRAFIGNLEANMANLIVSEVSKIRLSKGSSAARDAFDYIASITNPTSGLSNEEQLDILQQISSGKLNNSDDLYKYLKLKGHSLSDKKINNISGLFNLFKENRSYKNWSENFADDWEFYNSIKSSTTGVFSQEDIDKLLATRSKDIKASDFDEGHYTGNVEDLAESYRKYLISEIEATKDALEAGMDSAKTFIDTTKDKKVLKKKEELKNITEDTWTKFFNNQLDAIKKTDLRAIMNGIFGENTKLYNAQAGTKVQLKDISDEDLAQYADYYLTNDFENWAIELLDLGEKEEQIKSKFESLGNEIKDGINRITQEASKTYSKEFVGKLLQQLINAKDIIKEDKDIEQFFSDGFLAGLDWDNINNINQFTEALNKLGVTFDKDAEGALDLFNNLKAIYKGSKLITAEQVFQTAQFGNQLKNKVKTTGRGNYSQEEVEYILAQSENKEELQGKFTRDLISGGYTYTGDVETLQTEVLAALTKNGFDQLEAQYNLSTSKGEKLSSEYDKYTQLLFGKNAGAINDEELRQIKLWREQQGEIAYNYNLAKDMLPYVGKTNDQIRNAGASTEVVKAAVLQDAGAAGFNTNEVAQYAEQLQKVTELQEETKDLSEEMAYAIAYDNMLMNQGLSELASNFDTWNKNLKDSSTPEYTTAVEGLRTTLQKITGTTYNFKSEFLASTKALELFKKAAKGDTDAINELRKSAAKAQLEDKGLNLDISKIKDEGGIEQSINDFIDGLDLDAIPLGATIEQAGLKDAFQQIIAAAGMTADEANALLESIGFEPTVTMVQAPIESEETTEGELRLPNGQVYKTGSYVKTDGGFLIPSINGDARFKGGAKQTVNKPKTGGGGGGKKEYKNEFDKYYNQVEDIKELERLRNLLESDYNQLLKQEVKSGKEIYDNLKRQLDLLEERRALTADLAEKRKQQLFETMNDDYFKSVRQYAAWNDTDRTIEIDWDAINEVKDSETGDLINEYVKKLEDFQSKYDEQIEALEDIEDAVQEIKERGREEYISLEDRVRDALIKQIQDKIDELQSVEEAINDTNQRLFDSISETLDQQRQQRDNAKTEDELTDKEKRLAYLQQDSSNANQVEIAKLQEELADARQSYTDTLIDQKISELQKQNEEAQEQRQQQIELMQQSLEWQQNSGAFWDQVYEYISEGTDQVGALIHESELESLLKKAENWDALSEEQKAKWAGELVDQVTQGVAFLSLNKQLENIGTKAGSSITFTNGNGQTLTGTVDKNGNVTVTNADGSKTTYKDIFQDYHGTYRTFEEQNEANTVKPPATNTQLGANPGSTTGTSATSDKPQSWGFMTNEIGAVTKIWGRPNKANGINTFDTYNKAKAAAVQKNQQLKAELNSQISQLQQDIDSFKKNGEAEKANAKQKELDKLKEAISNIKTSFKTGGLADFTGPAWLDGTSSKPELVLNARDTENFIQLKDALADLRKSSISLVGGGGDNYYDIDVHVDSMSSDYDVDKAIDRIKARIAQDGAYRNVNTLSRLR